MYYPLILFSFSVLTCIRIFILFFFSPLFLPFFFYSAMSFNCSINQTHMQSLPILSLSFVKFIHAIRSYINAKLYTQYLLCNTQIYQNRKASSLSRLTPKILTKRNRGIRRQSKRAENTTKNCKKPKSPQPRPFPFTVECISPQNAHLIIRKVKWEGIEKESKVREGNNEATERKVKKGRRGEMS